MRHLRAFLGLAFVLALPLLAACHPAPRDEAVELRTYDVPKGTASSLLTTFKDIMWMGDNKLVGRAVITPDGRLAVLATPAVQAGVQSLVEELTKHPPTGDQTVELHYFLVLGKAAAAPQAYPAGVGEIKQALDEIVRSQGPQAFTLAQRVGLSSMHDEEGRLDNTDAKLEIRQHAAQTSDGVYAKLSIRWKDDKVETRVHLAPDRIVVLGATGQHAADPADGVTLYYIVRVAPRADGKAP
jgi:hypothetical protein